MSQIKLQLRGIARLMTMCAAAVCMAVAQAPVTPVGADTSTQQKAEAAAAPPVAVPVSATPKTPERIANYVLGSEDQILIRAFQAEELSDKPIQIAGDGYINLALVGRVKAAGLTVSALENDLSERLKLYVRDPQVSVFIVEYRSQPVSVVGDVVSPGVVQLRGRKTLVEVIALAGGLKPDAGNTATITRELSSGRLPLVGSTDDPNGRVSTGHVNLHDVMNGQDPNGNLLIETNDVIMIPKARLLYVVGEVQRPGGYILTDKDSLTVLQAVAMAGGLTSGAAPKKARILHQTNGEANRTEIATNVRKILDGAAPDVALHADDILFVPSNLPKSVGGKALQTAMNMAGVAVWKL